MLHIHKFMKKTNMNGKKQKRVRDKIAYFSLLFIYFSQKEKKKTQQRLFTIYFNLREKSLL